MPQDTPEKYLFSELNGSLCHIGNFDSANTENRGIQGIVNGIKSCIGKVKDAVTNVAETIRSFLQLSAYWQMYNIRLQLHSEK